MGLRSATPMKLKGTGRAPRVGAVCFLLVRDARILMERDPKKSARYGGTWFLPGGRIERSDAHSFATLVREMAEELECLPVVCAPLPLVDASGVPAMRPFLMRPFWVQSWAGEIPDVCRDRPEVRYRWVPLEEARKSPVLAVRHMLNALDVAIALSGGSGAKAGVFPVGFH